MALPPRGIVERVHYRGRAPCVVGGREPEFSFVLERQPVACGCMLVCRIDRPLREGFSAFQPGNTLGQRLLRRAAMGQRTAGAAGCLRIRQLHELFHGPLRDTQRNRGYTERQQSERRKAVKGRIDVWPPAENDPATLGYQEIGDFNIVAAGSAQTRGLPGIVNRDVGRIEKHEQVVPADRARS